MERLSWTSHFIVPCPINLAPAKNEKATCKFHETSKEKNEIYPKQHVFTEQIIAKCDDPRSFLIKKFGVCLPSIKLEPILFDPKIDPLDGHCFNCWQSSHSYKVCTKPKLYEFCFNCGRRGLEVYSCPRCSRGYREFVMRKKEVENRKFRQETDKSAAPNDENVTPNTHLMQCSAEEKGIDELDLTLENKSNVDDRECDESQSEYKSIICFDSIIEDAAISVDDRWIEEEDNYDEIIVDESERSLSLQSTSDAVVDFMKLIDVVKHLPLETQSILILQFVKERRQKMRQENIPSKDLSEICKMF